jgi:hypothetical protein
MDRALNRKEASNAAYLALHSKSVSSKLYIIDSLILREAFIKYFNRQRFKMFLQAMGCSTTKLIFKDIQTD